MLQLLPAMQMKRFSCRCRYTTKRYTTKVAASTSHLIDSQSCGRRAGDLNLSSQRTRRCSALPRPATPRALPLLCLNMGLLKRHMEFMRAQGLRRCCALSGHSQSEWQTENDKEATAANKENCRQWSRVSGRGSGEWSKEEARLPGKFCQLI